MDILLVERAQGFKNGKKDGLWKSSNDTGNSEIITYKNGKKDGYYERIFNMIKTVGRYSDDKKDGKWITYDEKGQVLTEIFFKKDVEVKI
jgi:antitoxin component YwqK of YwqJK toxin-antitoxin module